MLDVATVASNAGVVARVFGCHIVDDQGAILEDVHPAMREPQSCLPGRLPGPGRHGEEEALPGSQFSGVQDAVFALPLNERRGVPLGFAPQQGRVARIHGRALRLHLEGDEN